MHAYMHRCIDAYMQISKRVNMQACTCKRGNMQKCRRTIIHTLVHTHTVYIYLYTCKWKYPTFGVSFFRGYALAVRQSDVSSPRCARLCRKQVIIAKGAPIAWKHPYLCPIVCSGSAHYPLVSLSIGTFIENFLLIRSLGIDHCHPVSYLLDFNNMRSPFFVIVNSIKSSSFIYWWNLFTAS